MTACPCQECRGRFRTSYSDPSIGISFSSKLPLGVVEDLLKGKVLGRRKLGTPMNQRADACRFSTLDRWVGEPRRKT